MASHRPEESPNPPGASHRVTSEPLKKRKTLSQWVKPRETKPHTAGWPVQVLYRTIDYATIDSTQHFSKTGLGILYPLCTKPTSMMKCGQGVVCVEGRLRRQVCPLSDAAWCAPCTACLRGAITNILFYPFCAVTPDILVIPVIIKQTNQTNPPDQNSSWQR